MNILHEIASSYFRNDLPSLEVGEKVEVVNKIWDKKDPKKYRLSSFKGTIIACRNKKQISYTFTVLKESKKIMVKNIYFYHSPLIDNIKKIGKLPKVRRAKLFYLERLLAEKKNKE